MINFRRYFLTAWHTDIPFYVLLDRDIDVLTERFSDLLTLTWFVTELMTWLDCIVLMDCMSVLVCFLVYLLWTFKRWISNLPCIARTGKGVGTSFRRHDLWNRLSQPISFEAVRVVRIREQQFKVLVSHARNHLVHELRELARRGVKKVHSIMKKGLG